MKQLEAVYSTGFLYCCVQLCSTIHRFEEQFRAAAVKHDEMMKYQREDTKLQMQCSLDRILVSRTRKGEQR